MDKKSIWKLVIQTLVTILTAIGTTLGVACKTGQGRRSAGEAEGVFTYRCSYLENLDKHWYSISSKLV